MGYDSFVDVQAEEMNFWDVLADIIYSLPEDEREEVIVEITKSMKHS